ncbi:hypothetical protein A3Q56_08191, partial [Intoshia linei]
MKTYKNLNNNTQKPFQNNNYYNKKVRLVENGNLCENVKLSTKGSEIEQIQNSIFATVPTTASDGVILIKYLIDIGSAVNTINADLFKKFKDKIKIEPISLCLRTYSNDKIKHMGLVKLQLHPLKPRQSFFITNEANIIGCDLAIKLKLIQLSNPNILHISYNKINHDPYYSDIISEFN